MFNPRQMCLVLLLRSEHNHNFSNYSPLTPTWNTRASVNKQIKLRKNLKLTKVQVGYVGTKLTICQKQ